MAPCSKRRRQVVVAFDERSDMRSSSLRGGKGASLAEMRALGLPVPSGFTITTTVARGAMQTNVLPKRLQHQLVWGMEKIERATGKKFGDSQNPLLLSVRSGAEVSMPGMMDTILNLGLNDEIAEELSVAYGDSFPQDCWHRFSVMYRTASDCDSVPRDPWTQLHGAIQAVLDSWNSERAVAYRKSQGISEHLGTAVNVQAMVFGNRNERSGTGVVFSRDPNTGAPGLYGEFLPCAQGEDVVSGSHTPMPITAMKEWNSLVFDELSAYVAKLEDHFDTIVDVEFTVEDSKLWLLQCRPAKLSGEAKATFAVHRVFKKRWSKEQAIESVSTEELSALDVRPVFAEKSLAGAEILGTGIAASNGVAVGKVATSSEEAVAMSQAGEDVILLRHETDPKDLPGMLAAKAIVTLKGGATSHAAVVARQLGLPAVVGVESMSNLPAFLSVCGNTGRVYAGRLQVTLPPEHKKEINLFLKWRQARFPEPRIDFGSVHKQICVNRLLAEVYLLERMAQIAKGSRIEYQVVKASHNLLVKTAEMFVCYLAIAVSSELRHAWNYSIFAGHGGVLEKMKENFGIDDLCRRGDEQILETLKNQPVAQQVEYFKQAAALFDCPGWIMSSYGGPKWGAIARAGESFLSGRLNHGVFVDHVFDLRHNGGCLFDKHSMVSSRTVEGKIQHQLDLKRGVSDLASLHYWLLMYASDFYRYDPFSAEFVRLWEEGKRLNLWKEKTK